MNLATSSTDVNLDDIILSAEADQSNLSGHPLVPGDGLQIGSIGMDDDEDDSDEEGSDISDSEIASSGAINNINITPARVWSDDLQVFLVMAMTDLSIKPSEAATVTSIYAGIKKV